MRIKETAYKNDGSPVVISGDPLQVVSIVQRGHGADITKFGIIEGSEAVLFKSEAFDIVDFFEDIDAIVDYDELIKRDGSLTHSKIAMLMDFILGILKILSTENAD